MKFYKATSQYPAYTHTSFNLKRSGRVTFHLSLHVKHAFGGGGFWFGLRPEIEISRNTDEVEKFLKAYREVKFLERCSGCGAEAWSPKDWVRVSMHRTACPDCTKTKTLAELGY